MTSNELAADALAKSVARTKAADEEALLAAESFAFGVFDRYIAAKVANLERRISEHFGDGGTSVFADPATL